MTWKSLNVGVCVALLAENSIQNILILDIFILILINISNIAKVLQISWEPRSNPEHKGAGKASVSTRWFRPLFYSCVLFKECKKD